MSYPVRPTYRAPLVYIVPAVRTEVKILGHTGWTEAFITFDGKLADSIICEKFVSSLGGNMFSSHAVIQIKSLSRQVSNELVFPMPMDVKSWQLKTENYGCLFDNC